MQKPLVVKESLLMKPLNPELYREQNVLFEVIHAGKSLVLKDHGPGFTKDQLEEFLNTGRKQNKELGIWLVDAVTGRRLPKPAKPPQVHVHLLTRGGQICAFIPGMLEPLNPEFYRRFAPFGASLLWETMRAATDACVTSQTQAPTSTKHLSQRFLDIWMKREQLRIRLPETSKSNWRLFPASMTGDGPFFPGLLAKPIVPELYREPMSLFETIGRKQ